MRGECLEEKGIDTSSVSRLAWGHTIKEPLFFDVIFSKSLNHFGLEDSSWFEVGSEMTRSR